MNNKSLYFAVVLVMLLVTLLTACGGVHREITVVGKEHIDVAGITTYYLHLKTCSVDDDGQEAPTTCTFDTISVGQTTYDRNTVGSRYNP